MEIYLCLPEDAPFFVAIAICCRSILTISNQLIPLDPFTARALQVDLPNRHCVCLDIMFNGFIGIYV